MRSPGLVFTIFTTSSVVLISVSWSVWLAGCTPSPPPPPANLLLISIDTLVPDRMSTYGNPRPTTPAVSGLAAGGLVFTRAYSPSSWTLPAHASMLTGRYPMSLSPNPYDLDLYRAAPLLSQLFRAEGYQTAAVTGGGYVSAEFGAGRGFDFFEEGVAERAVDWLEEHAANTDKPFFLFFHSYIPHVGYADRRFAEGQSPGRLKGAFRFGVDPVGLALCCEEGMDATPEEREFLLALYDSNVALADEQVALLVAALARLGVSDRTTVIVTSDHGEEFWQHTGLAARHGHTLYDELLRIPLIWYEPGLPTAGTRCDTPVNLVDLVPTVVARFALAPPDRSDGIDLSPLLSECLHGDGFNGFDKRAMLAEGIRDGAARYSVRTSKGKLIETPNPRRQRGLGESYPVPVRARRELYLPGDEGERHNAFDEQPELAAELTALLHTHRPRRPAASSGPAMPPLSKKAQHQLKALGYIQ